MQQRIKLAIRCEKASDDFDFFLLKRRSISVSFF